MQTYEIFACLFLLLFTLVATTDGLYFHLFKYKLYSRQECLKEHHLHTLNSFLFPFTILLLFCLNVSGILLWLCVALTLLTLIVEFIDVFEEKKSREKLGGLTSSEYAMHFAMSGIRATYTTIILALKPAMAWSITSPMLILNHSYFIGTQIIGYCVSILGIPIFVLHFYLGRQIEKKQI